MPSQNERLLELLWAVNQEMHKHVRDVLTEYDIPFPMMISLRMIGAEPGITISELSRRTSIAKSHISNTIRELVKRGWVEKRADAADQRLERLYLTEQATQATEHLKGVKADINRRISRLVAAVPEQLAADLITNLEALQAVLQQNKEKGKNTDA